MENKNKNILIGGLLAIVLVMAIGYAAFATQLTINGTATIDTTSYSWSVHYDTSKTSNGVTTAGYSSNYPEYTTVYDSDTAATIDVTLKQPGDKVVFTFTVVNDGTLDATVPTLPTLSSEGNDFVSFEVGSFSSTSLTAGSTVTFTVTASYNTVYESDGTTTATPTDDETSVSTTVTFTANQAS